MKTTFLLSMVFCTVWHCSYSAYAQGVAFGVKAGVNYATQKYNYSGKVSEVLEDNWQKRKIGLKAGISADVLLSKHLFFSPAILFNQKGFRDNVTYTDENGNALDVKPYVRINYLSLDLPVKAKVQLGKVKPYFLVGPRVDFLVNHASKGLFGYDFYKDVFDRSRKVSVGIVTALGAEFPVRGKVIPFLELEYNPDVTPTYKTEFLTIKNSLVAINTGIRFAKPK